MALILPIAANSRPFSDLSTIKASVFFSVAVAQFSSVPASEFLPLKYNQLTGKGLFRSEIAHLEKVVVVVLIVFKPPADVKDFAASTRCHVVPLELFQI